ncbi:uncharacterized protein SCHCODRAFT_01327336 [Schizophyllum commune H4-8]|nr:uncharacterized protein SCHCODRAFT_01327336 [Schizophyllum commune H4-8]KAI5889667.1 hypothetical protein SCHCODRAFT_01327336 [Schizophyllum commune H4-8]
MRVLATRLCAQCGNTLTCTYPPAPSIDLLRAGHVPSPNEHSEIRQDISALGASLAAIDAELSSIKARLATLEHHRIQLAESKCRKQALIAPINRLPIELLELIIHAALPPTWTTASIGTTRFPLLETCYRFRRTALGMPELWCKIIVGDMIVDERFCAIAQLYMDRAGSRPVDALYVPEFTRGEAVFDQWIISHMGRLRNIRWLVDTHALPVTRLSAPFLESATFMAHRDISLHPVLTIVDAPRLSKVTIHNFETPLVLDIPWAQLESLVVQNTTLRLENMHTILSCASLTTLEVRVSTAASELPHGEGSTQFPVITMNALRSLKLAECGLSLSAIICAPNLHELEMWENTWCLVEVPGIFARFTSPVRTMLERSPPRLHTLTLHGFPCCKDDDDLNDILSILRLVPHVRRLKLGYDAPDAYDIPFLHRLSRRQDQPFHLPDLEHIALDYYGADFVLCPGFEDALRELALSRWGVGNEKPTERMSLHSRTCKRVRECCCEVLDEWVTKMKVEGIIFNKLPCGLC